MTVRHTVRLKVFQSRFVMHTIHKGKQKIHKKDTRAKEGPFDGCIASAGLLVHGSLLHHIDTSPAYMAVGRTSMSALRSVTRACPRRRITCHRHPSSTHAPCM
jgi:hypothetical protein